MVYVNKIKDQIAQWEKELDKLKIKSGNTTGNTLILLDTKIHELKGKIIDAKEQLPESIEANDIKSYRNGY